MSASVKYTSNAPVSQDQELSNIKEENQMTFTKKSGKLNMRISNAVARKFSGNILGGLALGALIAAATVLPLGTAYASPAVTPPVPEAVIEIEDKGVTQGGPLAAPITSVINLGAIGLAEENYHPVTGELEGSLADKS